MGRVIDGHEVAELYTSAERPAREPSPPGEPSFVRGTRSGRGRWEIRQRHQGSDPSVLNQAVLTDLAGGVEAIELCGVDPADLDTVLDGVLLDAAPVSFAANGSGDGAWALISRWASQGVADRDAAGAFGIDPIGAGSALDPTTEAALVSAAAVSVERFPKVRSVGVDASVWAEHGASPAVEVGRSIATAIAYLRALDAGGLAVVDALGELEFTYQTSADQFVTMAKLRAARRLWYRVAEVCGAPALVGAQRQRAITPTPSGDHPWDDVLAGTVACFAAGAGGAEAVTVRAFDTDATTYDAGFAARIARNTHHLLLEESHVAEVIDPAGGAPYVEVLTEVIARQAWAEVQDIESAGGMAAALADGRFDVPVPS